PAGARRARRDARVDRGRGSRASQDRRRHARAPGLRRAARRADRGTHRGRPQAAGPQGGVMATSQNGWPVYTSGSHPDLVAIPKVVGRVRRGDVATVFTYLVDRFDREVEDVDVGADEWG